jgi:hypothetical protein
MRYIQPTITGTFDAVSTIMGAKEPPILEGSGPNHSASPAYPADE